jgi:hypothetical protein
VQASLNTFQALKERITSFRLLLLFGPVMYTYMFSCDGGPEAFWPVVYSIPGWLLPVLVLLGSDVYFSEFITFCSVIFQSQCMAVQPYSG